MPAEHWREGEMIILLDQKNLDQLLLGFTLFRRVRIVFNVIMLTVEISFVGTARVKVRGILGASNIEL